MTATSDAATGNDPELWGSRVLRRPLMDSDGSVLGHVRDLVMTPGGQGQPPQLKGFVANVDRREIFVHLARVDALDLDGIHLRGGTVDLRRFARRNGEVLVNDDVLGLPTSQGPVRDVGFAERPDGKWVLTQVAAAARAVRRRRTPIQTISWSEIAPQLGIDPLAREAGRLQELHKADAAAELGALPTAQRNNLAAALDAGSLADVMEELPEGQQVEIIEHLSTLEAVAVLSEMEIDDEIDLLKELPEVEREELFSAMDNADVNQLRRLITYNEDTAGGMMTPEAVVVSPTTSVAAAIARLRDLDLPPALSVRLFVAESPTAPPTGPYRGTVTLPRLLQEPPNHAVETCIDDQTPTLDVTTPEADVAQLLARYDLLAVAVVDKANRFLGAVTVDDVLVRLIPQVGGR